MRSDWEQINTLFNRILHLPEEQHEDFLNSAEFKSPKLRKEVESLLSAYKKAPDYFNGFAQSVLGEEHKLEDQEEALSPIDADPYELLGKHVSHFQIFDSMPPGGMGIVYRAHDERLNREAALKFLPIASRNDQRARDRFIQEARAASALDHVNVGTIYAIDETPQGDPFIAMAFYEGDTLEDRISEGRLSPHLAVDLGLQACEGLHAAHQKGIIHRDIKPANLMLLDDGILKILDFGLARIGDTGLTKTGEVRGTISYMSPEHIKGEKVEPCADVWSLGVVLYEMMAGERPFKGAGAETVMYEIFHTDPDMARLKNAPLALKRIVDKCLQREAAKRFQTIAEVKQALEAVKPEVDQLEQGTRVLPTWVDELRVKRWKARPAIIAFMVLLPLAIILSLRGNIILKPFGMPNLPGEKRIVVLSAAGAEEGSLEKTLEDGLSSNIVRTLQMLEQFDRSMWVVPSEKVIEYGIKQIEQASSVLGANLVMNVDVEQVDGRIKLIIALIDPVTNEVLDQHQVERTSDYLTVLQEDIVGVVSTLLQMKQQPSVRQELTAGTTRDAVAFENYTKGLAYLQRGDDKSSIETAVKFFTEAIKYDPQYALAHAALGRAYWYLYQDTKDIQWLKEAEQISEKALQLNADAVPVYLIMGRVHNAMGKYGTARAAYRLALQQDPKNFGAYQGIARTYEVNKNLEEAEKNYIKAISLKPNYWDGYNTLGVFYLSHGRYEDAVAQFKKVIELTPENTWAYNNLGATYWFLKDTEKAIAMFNSLISIEPDYSTYSNLATLYYYEGDYKKAARMYEKALEIEDSDFSVWGNLASAYELSEASAEKIKYANDMSVKGAKQKLQANPQDVDALSKLATYYIALDKKDKALEIHKKLELLYPDNVETISRVGRNYELLGEREKAIKWLSLALEKGYSIVEIERSPNLTELRKDKNFQLVLERYNSQQ